MKIAGVQMDVALMNSNRNLDRMISALQETSANGARLTVFPECALSGYCFASLDEARPFAQPIPGPATERLRAACAELGSYAIFGMLELDGPRVFNAAVLVVTNNYKQIREIYIFAGVLVLESLPFLSAVAIAILESSRINSFKFWRETGIRTAELIGIRPVGLPSVASPRGIRSWLSGDWRNGSMSLNRVWPRAKGACRPSRV